MAVNTEGQDGKRTETWFDLALRLDGISLPEASALTGASIEDLCDLRGLRRECAALMRRERGAACLAQAPYPGVAPVILKARNATAGQLRMACELAGREARPAHLGHLADWQVLSWALDLGVERIHSADALESASRASFGAQPRLNPGERREGDATYLVTGQDGGARILKAASLREACVTALPGLGSPYACAAELRPGDAVSVVDAPGGDEFRVIDRSFPTDGPTESLWRRAEAMSEAFPRDDAAMIRDLLPKPQGDEHLALWLAALLQYGPTVSALRNAPRRILENAVVSSFAWGPGTVFASIERRNEGRWRLDDELRPLKGTIHPSHDRRMSAIEGAARERGTQYAALLKAGCLGSAICVMEQLNDSIPAWMKSALLSRDLAPGEPLRDAYAEGRSTEDDNALLDAFLKGVARDRDWIAITATWDEGEARRMAGEIATRPKPRPKRARERSDFLKRYARLRHAYFASQGSGPERRLGFVAARGLQEAQHLMSAEGFEPDRVERLAWLVPTRLDSYAITARRTADRRVLDMVADAIPAPAERAPRPSPDPGSTRALEFADAARRLPAEIPPWQGAEWKDSAMIASLLDGAQICEFLGIDPGELRRLREVDGQIGKMVEADQRWHFLKEMPLQFASGLLRALDEAPAGRRSAVLEKASEAGGPSEQAMVVAALALARPTADSRKGRTILRAFLDEECRLPRAVGDDDDTGEAVAAIAGLLSPHWDRAIGSDNADDAMRAIAERLIGPRRPKGRARRREEPARPDACQIRARLMAFAREQTRIPN